MHEYSAVKRIVQNVNETAAGYGAGKVSAVHIVVGENSGIAPDSVRMYYDIIAAGSAAQGAKLHIQVAEAEMSCPKCGKDFRRQHPSFDCPVCGEPGVPTQKSGECYVEHIEIETD